jgi:hypothetical protein
MPRKAKASQLFVFCEGCDRVLSFLPVQTKESQTFQKEVPPDKISDFESQQRILCSGSGALIKHDHPGNNARARSLGNQ